MKKRRMLLTYDDLIEDQGYGTEVVIYIGKLQRSGRLCEDRMIRMFDGCGFKWEGQNRYSVIDKMKVRTERR